MVLDVYKRQEQQFVIGIPAREMEVCSSDELVLIQGIIDAYMDCLLYTSRCV